MHVLWVIYGSLAELTGGYIYDRLIADGLSTVGDRVEVLSLARGGHGFELVERIGAGWAEVVVLDALCAPDLAFALPRLESVPTVLLVHHLQSWEPELPDTAGLRQAERLSISHSSTWIATSHATAGRLSAEFEGCECHVIVPGADRLPRLARSRRRADRLRLLVVGSLIRRKRVHCVVEAVSRCGSSAIELRIAGDHSRDPDYVQEIEAAVGTCPERHRVRLLGPIDDESLARELAGADFLVLASSLEGYGIVLGEALHAGLPRLVSREAALPEVIGDARDVLVFEGTEDLARLLARLAQDPGERSQLQAVAAARSAEVPTWARSSAAFRRTLTATLASARQNPQNTPSRLRAGAPPR